LKDSLQRRFAENEKDRLLQLAATLDPKFELKWCSGSQPGGSTICTSEGIRSILNTEARAIAPPPPTDEQPVATESLEAAKPPSKKSRLFSTFQFIGDHAGQAAVGSDCEAEVSSYLAELTLRDFDSNPLHYWKENRHRLPTLSTLARKVLCVPATSAPVERVFSTTVHIVSPFRSCLKPDMVEKLVFVKRNILYGVKV